MRGIPTPLGWGGCQQEAFQEGEQRGRQEAQLENIPRMASYGLSSEVIAQLLQFPVETVTGVLENLDLEISE